MDTEIMNKLCELNNHVRTVYNAAHRDIKELYKAKEEFKEFLEKWEL